MKKFIIILLLLIGGFTVSAQSYKKDANGNLIAQNEAKEKTPDVKTEMIIIKNDSISYPVYQGSKGGYYIKRISKKSGKEYKQYIKIEE